MTESDESVLFEDKDLNPGQIFIQNQNNLNQKQISEKFDIKREREPYNIQIEKQKDNYQIKKEKYNHRSLMAQYHCSSLKTTPELRNLLLDVTFLKRQECTSEYDIFQTVKVSHKTLQR